MAAVAKAPSTLETASSGFDFVGALRALRAGEASDAWLSRWLPVAYADPEAFEQALYDWVALRRSGLKASRTGPFDLYGDCVLAHLGAKKRATVVASTRGVQQLSYEELHRRSGALYSAWRARGVEPGQVVLLGLPVGIDYAIALVTALRLGVVLCPAPAAGPAFLHQRLLDAKPDFAVLRERDQALLRNLSTQQLPIAGERDLGAADSYSYATDEAALRCFSAFGREPLAPLDVPAGMLHAALLRDSQLVFALDSSDTLAAPGWDPLLCQPSLLLTCLFAGAAYAELGVEDVIREPRLLDAVGASLLGVSPRLRDGFTLLSEWPTNSVRAWFRSLTHALDWSEWERLGQLSNAKGIACFNMALAQSAGGALLFGARLKQDPNLRAWPVPGRPWLLTEVAGGTLESFGDAGVYTPTLEEEAIAGVPQLVLSRKLRGYECSGAIDLGPDAQAYPIEEVSRVVARHPLVAHASVVVSGGRGINGANVTLLAFVEDGALERGELLRWLEGEMGQRYLPSRVEVFALQPRVGEEGIDHGWCRSQYLSGALTKKARDPLFRMISRLGYLLAAPAGA
ncbi:MAG: AMP-binding protein [Myxococcota bacterium]